MDTTRHYCRKSCTRWGCRFIMVELIQHMRGGKARQYTRHTINNQGIPLRPPSRWSIFRTAQNSTAQYSTQHKEPQIYLGYGSSRMCRWRRVSQLSFGTAQHNAILDTGVQQNSGGGASGCLGVSTYGGGGLLGRSGTPGKSIARHGGSGGGGLKERTEGWGRRGTTTFSIVGQLKNG